jgi:hypothetical protein
VPPPTETVIEPSEFPLQFTFVSTEALADMVAGSVTVVLEINEREVASVTVTV